MDIKKVEDKEMVIHTKENTKIHTHISEQSRMKDNMSYLSDKTENMAIWNDKPVSSKSSIIEKLKSGYKDSSRQVKVKNKSLHIRKDSFQPRKMNSDSMKSGIGFGASVMSEQIEGGNELRDAYITANTIAEPVKNISENTLRATADLNKRIADRAIEEAKKRIKKVDAKKKIVKDKAKSEVEHQAKKLAKGVAKKAAKDTAKETSKETSKAVAKATAETTAEVAATVGTEIGTTAAGSAAGPYGALIGLAAGQVIGEEVGKRMEIQDKRISNRLRKIRWFIDKTKEKEEQKDSFFKMIKDVLVRDLMTAVKVHKSLFLVVGSVAVLTIIAVASPVVVVLGTIYSSPLAIFFPMPETDYDDPRTVLSSYYMEFNQNIVSLEDGGTEISYQNTSNGTPVSNYNDTLAVFMTLYGDGEAAYVMDDEGKENLREVFDAMNYMDDTSTSEEKQVGDSLGMLWITAYCPCEICCGSYSNGITASGTTATARHTIAVDAYNPIVPMGTKLIIDGVEYVVEDTGNLNAHGNDIDIYYATHDAALGWGRQNVEVFIADGNSNTVTVTTAGTTVHNLTYEDYMNEHSLNEEQKEMLEEMMDPDVWADYYASEAGQSVANLAITKIGCKYDQDKRDDEGYYDCSSLVYRLYRECGIELPTRSAEQGKYCFENAMLVNKEELIPGDLIFYSSDESDGFRNISHVAIYVGDGKIVHAANEDRGVVMDSLYETDLVFYARPYK